MYKLVIVEDEDHIRNSLASFIPWEKMGFQVVATFSDGSDALTYLKDNPADTVLTDILMSRMSGLEMIRQLHEIHPQLKVVILSGHSDFTYAQQAIRYRVEDYLTKPVDEDELMDAFESIREQLDLEQAERALTAREAADHQTSDELQADFAGSVIADYKLLILELDLGCQQTLRHILDDIIHQLQSTPVENMRTVLKKLYSVVMLNYKKRKINVLELSDEKFSASLLDSTDDPAALAQYAREAFAALCAGLQHKRLVSEHSVILHIVAFLKEHMHEDIGHDVLAMKHHIHPGYLSRLFKQEMGETLSEYLLRNKIEKAAALLKTGEHKIGEIATMLGYSTASYFSIMFKKYTGHSPREYSHRVSL